MKMITKWQLSLLLWLVCLSKAEDKIWNQGLDMGKPEQWLDKKLPCPGQRIVLPKEVVTFFPASLEIAPELILPENGMVLLHDRSEITLLTPDKAQEARAKDAKCKERLGDAVYAPPEFFYWHDPTNWRSTKEPQNLLPHLQRLPCRYDRAVFPPEVAPHLGLHHHPVDVSRIEVNGNEVDSSAFRGIYDSPLGRLTFNINQSLTVHQDHCTDPKGCTCGNEEIRETVCGLLQTHPQPEVQCSGALRAKGHCTYDMCGAIVNIDTYGSELKISYLEQVAQRNAKTIRRGAKSDQVNVNFHVSRVSNDHYQIILMDRDGKIQNAIDAGQGIYDYLYDQLYSSGMSVWIETSGVSKPSALAATGKAIGIIFGLLVVVLLLFFLKENYFYGPGRRNEPVRCPSFNQGWTSISGRLLTLPGFAFGRFHNEQGTASGLELNPSRPSQSVDPGPVNLKELSEHESSHEDLVQSFSNPMFDQDLHIPSAPKENEAAEDTEADVNVVKDGFENPIFDPMVSIEAIQTPEEEDENKKEVDTVTEPEVEATLKGEEDIQDDKAEVEQETQLTDASVMGEIQAQAQEIESIAKEIPSVDAAGQAPDTEGLEQEPQTESLIDF